MDPSLLPCDYSPSLSRREVHAARDCVQTFVEARLKTDLRVFKHTAPLALLADSGVNDDLDGSKSKSAVAFRVPNVDVPRGLGVDESKVAPGVHGFDAEVVQSLAKWKRLMLGRYDCEPGEGIFTEMHSIRKGYKVRSCLCTRARAPVLVPVPVPRARVAEETMLTCVVVAVQGDVIHSNVCDQWDWEVAVTKEQRTRATLCAAAAKVYRIIKDAEAHVRAAFPALAKHAWALPEELHVITSQELCDCWPHLGVLERETEAVKKWGAIFVVGLGWPMKDGSPAQEVRAPDYDDCALLALRCSFHEVLQFSERCVSVVVWLPFTQGISTAILLSCIHSRSGVMSCPAWVSV